MKRQPDIGPHAEDLMPPARKSRTLALTACAAATLMAAAPALDSALTFTANAGGTPFAGSGTGRCGRETAATLYEKPATLYLVEYAGSGAGDFDRIALTVWKFNDGSPDQIRLAFDAGRHSYAISTLQGGTIQGRGMAMISAAAGRGKITVIGQDARGVPIQMTVGCSTFEGIEADGG